MPLRSCEASENCAFRNYMKCMFELWTRHIKTPNCCFLEVCRVHHWSSEMKLRIAGTEATMPIDNMMLLADDKVQFYTSIFHWTTGAFSASPLAIAGICSQKRAKIKHFNSACVYSASSAVNLIFNFVLTPHLLQLSSSKHTLVQGEYFTFPTTTEAFCALNDA